MGLFKPSLKEKIRRSAQAALPEAEWVIDVDWDSGECLHCLHGTLADERTDEEAMRLAQGVWTALIADYRLHPDDGYDGLLDVGLMSAGGTEQRTGIHG